MPLGEYNDIPKFVVKEPDNCFINEETNNYFRKKFQNGGGSVAKSCKPVNKIRNLSRRYVTYKIICGYQIGFKTETNY